MSDEEIRAKVREKAAENRLPCRVALALADELGVPPKRIGDAANAEKIKIAACQLGCFK